MNPPNDIPLIPGEPRGWGPWTLDRDARVLVYAEDGSGYRYEVDLDWCRTSAEVLDWVCQVAGKTWADDAALAGLVRALDDVLHPQANLCPGGESKTLSEHQIAELVQRPSRSVQS